MTAHQYLSQLRRLRTIIQQRQEQAERIKQSAMSLGSPETDKERVQTSYAGSIVENAVGEYVEIEKETKAYISKYLLWEHIIIGQIQNLRDPRYVNILYKRYVEFKSYEMISVEMCYSFDYTKKLLKKALRKFSQHTTYVEM